MMKNALALLALAGSAIAAHGAGEVNVRLIPQSANIVPIGGTIRIDIFADYSGVIGGLSIAGFKFDIVGTNLFGAAPLGTLTGEPYGAFPTGRNPGTQIDELTLKSFAAGQLPPAFGGSYTGDYLGWFDYTYLGPAPGDFNYDSVTFSLATYNSFDGGALNVYISSSGAQSSSGPTFAGGHEVNITPATIYVGLFPAPGTLALGFVGLAAFGRRR